MNKKFLKRASAVTTFAGLLAAASPKLYAIDGNSRYFAYGVGQRSCADYIKFREKKLEGLEQQHPRYTKDELYEIVDKVVEHWIAGFLTAHNLYVSDTYNVAGKTSMDELKARLEKGCRGNTKQYFAEAVIEVIQELHPQRVRVEAGK